MKEPKKTIFDYEKDFLTWHNRPDITFSAFVLWLIHSSKSDEFLKKIIQSRKEEKK